MSYLESLDSWILQIFAIVLFVATINLLVRFVARQFIARAKKTNNVWDDAFAQSVFRPIRLGIWILGLSLAAQIAISHTNTQDRLYELITQLREAGVIVVIAWFLLLLVKNFQNALIEKRVKENAEVDKDTYEAISKLLRISIFVTGGLVLLQTFGFSITGALAFGGVGGIAIGFAAKDLLANIFGGLMIHLDRPFSVGHWIRSPDRDIEGFVESIGWRQTKIRSFRKNIFFVPNGLFMNIIVENPTMMTHRKIREIIGIRYDDFNKMPEIVSDVRNMLDQHKDIDSDQTIIANFTAFNDSSVDFLVTAYTKTLGWPEYNKIKQDVLFKIGQLIEKNNAEVAFPTTKVYMTND
jgi:MscS family membrane protein